jgi:SAM-dependent methyltransferase
MATPAPTEKTFTSYTAEQGAKYAKHRRGYHPNLYKTIIEQHTSTGGQLGTLLDVGCGPGIAARDLAVDFEHVIGIDPSGGMIDTARSLGGLTKSGEAVRFEVSSAESLGADLVEGKVEDGSVDLITAATSAHWFDMKLFWPAAARVLKPGGSIALWTTGDIGIDASVPNAEKIQKAMTEIEDRELRPYFEPGNLMTRSLYKTLVLPWMLESQTGVEAFEEKALWRREWGTGEHDSEEYYQGGGMNVNLDTMELMLSTMSPVQRWREANPEKVGTNGDVLKLMRGKIERLLQEAGVEIGQGMIKGHLKGVMLIVKKKS